MTERKTFFRNVLDAMIESRTRQAQREIAAYKHSNIWNDPAGKF